MSRGKTERRAAYTKIRRYCMADRNELLEAFYEEIDPDKRLALLNEYKEAVSEEEDPLLPYRVRLYDYRYKDPKDSSRRVDNYLMAILTFMFLYKDSRILPFRNVKETLRTVKDMQQDERVLTDDQYAEAFMMEVRNSVRRYFDTCKSDSYHKKFFGISHSSAEEKEKQRCIDAWKMSTGIAGRLKLAAEMDLFCRAVAEEYRLSRVDGMTLEEAYRNYKKK